MKDRLEEYLDGLLGPEDEARVREALGADAELRAECERALRFRGLLEGVAANEREVERVLGRVRRGRRRKGVVLRVVASGAVAAAILVAVHLSLRSDTPHMDGAKDLVAEQAHDFGRRLGAMAAARREGRVPRVGVGDLEVPPAAMFGVVFRGALGELGVDLDPEIEGPVQDELSGYFRAVWSLSDDVDGQYRRAEASLQLFRRLRSLGGPEVANAFYDVFRPGLADLGTARRVPAGTLRSVLGESRDRQRYADEYERAVALLERRYGRPLVRLVLERLAPEDRRWYWRDATQDGAGRDAVLTIRALVYRAAAEAGIDKLYVDLS